MLRYRLYEKMYDWIVHEGFFNSLIGLFIVLLLILSPFAIAPFTWSYLGKMYANVSLSELYFIFGTYAIVIFMIVLRYFATKQFKKYQQSISQSILLDENITILCALPVGKDTTEKLRKEFKKSATLSSFFMYLYLDLLILWSALIILLTPIVNIVSYSYILYLTLNYINFITTFHSIYTFSENGIISINQVIDEEFLA